MGEPEPRLGKRGAGLRLLPLTATSQLVSTLYIQESGQLLLNSLKVVDGVFLFDKQNLADEILLLKPDTYVKSTDYNYDSMNIEERNALEKVGSKIFFVPLLEKHSTSLIINKIKDMNI